MDRTEKILRHIKRTGQGIEIGPSHNPVAPKKEGYNVHILDHMSREQLIVRYKDHSVNLTNIEEVDFVWQGESYAEVTGKSKHYDWIIASHVIEHVPDLIGFIQECDTILKDDGVLSLAVPDKRYCFDHYRPITGIARIIDSHFAKSKLPTPGTIAEVYLNVVSKSGNISWDVSTRGQYHFLHSLQNAVEGMHSVQSEKTYIDSHVWCFVPHSFRLIIHDLFGLGLIPFQEVEFFPTVGCEFFITLGRHGKGIDKSRIEMVKRIEAEMKKGEGFWLSPKILIAKNKHRMRHFIRGLVRRNSTSLSSDR